jgi:hypothetical protein
MRKRGYLLAYEQHVDGAEVKVIKVREASKPFVPRMLSGIEL